MESNLRRRRTQPQNQRQHDEADEVDQEESTAAHNLAGFDQAPPADPKHATATSAAAAAAAAATDAAEGAWMNLESDEHLASTLTNNPMTGMTMPRLFVLLLIHKRRSIDWWRYKWRLLCLALVSIFHLILSIIESLYMNIALRSIVEHCKVANANPDDHDDAHDDAPIFILGHPRTGTTLLHSLLAMDTERFATCSTFCAGFPHAFLWFEDIGKMLFASMLTETRPMDNMKLDFDLPQEDELATCLLTGGRCSPYMSLYFPRDEMEYRTYQTLCHASPEDVQRWTDAFSWLCLKLRVRNVLQKLKKRKGSNGKDVDSRNLPQPDRLLLKSPCHTGRIRHILKMYPKAQFVFIHRHPLEVFLSSVHMANTTYGYMFLQQPTNDGMLEYILKQGELLLKEYISCVDDGVVEAGRNLVEVSFEELTQRPYETIEKIHNTLDGDKFVFGVGASDAAYPRKLREYCETQLKGYKRNTFDHVQLDEDVERQLLQRWKFQFDRFGYRMKHT